MTRWGTLAESPTSEEEIFFWRTVRQLDRVLSHESLDRMVGDLAVRGERAISIFEAVREDMVAAGHVLETRALHDDVFVLTGGCGPAGELDLETFDRERLSAKHPYANQADTLENLLSTEAPPHYEMDGYPLGSSNLRALWLRHIALGAGIWKAMVGDPKDPHNHWPFEGYWNIACRRVERFGKIGDEVRSSPLFNPSSEWTLASEIGDWINEWQPSFSCVGGGGLDYVSPDGHRFDRYLAVFTATVDAYSSDPRWRAARSSTFPSVSVFVQVPATVTKINVNVPKRRGEVDVMMYVAISAMSDEDVAAEARSHAEAVFAAVLEALSQRQN